MAVIRAQRNHNYTVMPNWHLRDKQLSLKAKGLMSYMLSLPDTWDYSIAGLASICGCGRDMIRSALAEMEKAGYLCRSRARNASGQLGDVDYTLHEQSQITPMSDNPTLDNPTLDNPMLEKPTQIITNISNYVSNQILTTASEDISVAADNAIALAGLTQDAVKIGVSATTIDKCVDKYSVSRVRAAIQIITKKDAVRNPNGMLIKALQDGWDIDAATARQQSQADKDAAIAHNQQMGAQSLTAVYGDIPQIPSTGNITQDIAALRDRIARIGSVEQNNG